MCNEVLFVQEDAAAAEADIRLSEGRNSEGRRDGEEEFHESCEGLGDWVKELMGCERRGEIGDLIVTLSAWRERSTMHCSTKSIVI